MRLAGRANAQENASQSEVEATFADRAAAIEQCHVRRCDGRDVCWNGDDARGVAVTAGHEAGVHNRVYVSFGSVRSLRRVGNGPLCMAQCISICMFWVKVVC